MIKAIELVRVSTDKQAGEDHFGVPSQRAVNKRTAAIYGLDIIHTVEIVDVSGKDVMLAPEMQQLVAMIENPEIGAVITPEFTRLMRPERFCDYALLQAFADSKTSLYLPEGPIDFSNKAGRLVGTLRAAMAGFECSEILERLWRGKEEKRKQGKYPGSRLPFGVGYDKKRGYFYTEDSTRVKALFTWILGGETSYRELSQRSGIHYSSIFDLIHNPIWTGWRIYDKKADPARRRKAADGRQLPSVMVPRPPEEIIRVKVIETPLITEKEFRDAGKILDVKRLCRRREFVVSRKQNKGIYNGFLFCDYCGAMMIPFALPRGSKYYVCRNRRSPAVKSCRCENIYIQRDWLEKELDNLLMKYVSSPEFSAYVMRESIADSVQETSAVKLRNVEAELARLSSRETRILESFFDSVISKVERDNHLRDIQSNRKKLMAHAELFRESVPLKLDKATISRAFEPFQLWNQLGVEERRQLLAVTIPRITIRGYQISALYSLFDSKIEPGIANPSFYNIKNGNSYQRNLNTTLKGGHWVKLPIWEETHD